MAWIPNQFRLTGGLNLEDPPFALPPGFLTNCSNYEVLPGGGYRRIQGYERFDGHARPSDATYFILPFTSGGTTTIGPSTTITGHTSGATAYVLQVNLTGGSWASGNAVGTLVIGEVVGTFSASELLYVSGSPDATTTGVAAAAVVTDPNYKAYLRLAQQLRRNAINLVTGGAGKPVVGGFLLGGNVYAIRPDSGNVPQLFQATSGGWSAVTLSQYLRYSNGTVAVVEGTTITGATSGATAVVLRVGIAAGNVTGPTFASGRFAIGSVTGTFVDTEVLNIGGIQVANAVGTQGTSSFLGGSSLFHVIVKNFYGSANQRRAYGCDGVNRAWEFDGSTFIFIETGMVTDTPQFIEEHRNNLFLIFPGGSLQNSATGSPLIWSVRQGAAEIGIGDTCTGMKSNGNNMLAVTGLYTTHCLSGTSNADWSMRSITNEIGSVANTIQEVGGQVMFLDQGGINIIVPAPFAYQDLSMQAISRNVRELIEASSQNAVLSEHIVNKTQYRIYFNDKSALVATFFGTKLMGWMLSNYADQITCAFSGLYSDGKDRKYVGTTGGYLMEMDAGTSFDGAPISSFLTIPFNYQKAPDRDKRFHKMRLEVSTPNPVTLSIDQKFDYGGDLQDSFENTTGNMEVGGFDLPEVVLEGVGRNIGVTISHSDDIDASFVVAGAMVQFSLYGVHPSNS